MKLARYYAYQMDGPRSNGLFELHAFDSDKVLLDPYAKSVHFPESFDRQAAMRPGSNMGKAPLGVLYEDEPPFDWGDDQVSFHQNDLVIYEMHVRGFTRRGNSGVRAEDRRDLPRHHRQDRIFANSVSRRSNCCLVHQYDPLEGNYWGYMTLNFFAPQRLRVRSL